MNYADEINKINERLDALQASFVQTQKNQVPVTAKTDSNAADIVALNKKVDTVVYPEWDGGSYSYFAGEKVSYNDKFYRCVQSHTSQPDWDPEEATSLWAEIGNPQEEFPEWKQPTGAHDAYSKGDKVSHHSDHWISNMDANVYEPGVYGWDLYK